jgi:hypothetical protein
LIGGGLGLGLLLAYKYATTGNIDIFGGTSQKQEGKTHAEFSIFPPVVRPGDTVTISGQILDANNTPTTIPVAYYQVNNGMGQMILSGELGKNVSNFMKVITIPQVADGGFLINITDELGVPSNTSGKNPMGPPANMPLPLHVFKQWGTGMPPQGDPYTYDPSDIGNNTMQPLPSLAPQNTRRMLSQLAPSGPPQTDPYSVSNYIAPRALNDFQRLDNNFARPF